MEINSASVVPLGIIDDIFGPTKYSVLPIVLKKEEELRLKEAQEQEKISKVPQEKTEIKQVKTTIKDGLYITVGNRAITKSDIVDEIKIILILNNESFSEDKRAKLQEMAINSAITRNIKQIEIENNSFLEFSQQDFKNEFFFS